MKWLWWLAPLSLAVACSSETPTIERDEDEIEEESDGDDEEPSGRLDAGKDAGRDAGKDSGKDTPAKDAGTPAKNDGGGKPASGGLPCDVREVVSAKCTSCHQGEGLFGAPMSLENHAAFHAENNEGRPFYEGALARVSGTERPVMPPPPATLTAAEKKILTDWFDAGAPSSSESCGDEEPNPKPDGGTGEEEISDCDIEMEFRAGSNGQPFKVPTEPDYYHCFYFKPDFAETTVGKGFTPLIDNDAILHHWLLFVRDDATKKAGTSERCSGVNPGATLIAGWAPGGEDTIAPPDVGIQLPRGPNVVYQLELHYNNTVGPQATDKSGVKLCATNKKQQHMAAIHYLGSENIIAPPGMSTAGSTCRPTKPVTLLNVNPHMHKSGYHAKMVINRKNGTKETYHDAPFSFESQVTYRKTASLEVGDTITATCTFKNDSVRIKTFAEGTEDEMCYLFTLAYPIGAMDTGSDLLGVGLPGPNRCMR